MSAHPPWRAGVSKGSLFGELRGVMDLDGERQFYIVPPSGPTRVQCTVSEELRPLVLENLFSVVRVAGFLHYDGTGPHPTLMEAQAIDGISEPDGHFSDLRGLTDAKE